jgi:hypothetical protein
VAPAGGVHGAEAPTPDGEFDGPVAEVPPVEELHPVARRAKAAAEAIRISGRALMEVPHFVGRQGVPGRNQVISTLHIVSVP